MDEDNLNRLFLLSMELDPSLAEEGMAGYKKIDKMFHDFKLEVLCGRSLETSIAQQAALVTAINTGQRCFLGGVTVVLESNCWCILPPWLGKPVSTVVSLLGGHVLAKPSLKKYVLSIGCPISVEFGFELVCNDWTGGVAVIGEPINLTGSQVFPLGGVFAASLGVGLALLHAMGIEPTVFHRASGMNLWRPDEIENWYHDSILAPSPVNFADNLWLLGLGHLGQAYSWILSMMPFAHAKELNVLLQDFEKVVPANYSAGLLSFPEKVGKMKTRVTAEWLEGCGISTKIVEAKYTSSFKREESQPRILIAGLDTLESRKSLRIEDYSLILDVGIGANPDGFDLIRLQNFSFNGMPPKELWSNVVQQIDMPATRRFTQNLKGCGFVKGIAVSFVGAASACVAVAEVLRAFNKGVKTSHQYLSLRDVSNRRVGVLGTYDLHEIKTGFTDFKT